jgi:hypothetical protein
VLPDGTRLAGDYLSACGRIISPGDEPNSPLEESFQVDRNGEFTISVLKRRTVTIEIFKINPMTTLLEKGLRLLDSPPFTIIAEEDTVDITILIQVTNVEK